MCGRYTQTLKADDLAAAMSALDETGGVAEDYNVAPTTAMPIVVASRPEQAGAARARAAAGSPSTEAASPTETVSAEAVSLAEAVSPAESGPLAEAVPPAESAPFAESAPPPGSVSPPESAPPRGGGAPAPGRVLRLATWGLVPFWAKDPSIGSRLINARSESVASKPAFRAAFAARRCLVPATGFYEWQRVGGSRRGQPYYVHPAGHPGADGLFAFAGLYEVWTKGERPLTTFTILTTDAPPEIESIHDRSPVVVPRSAWSRWLDPTLRDTDALTGLLRPAPAGVFTAHPVSPAVGSVRNTGRHLIDPVEIDQVEIDPAGDRQRGGRAGSRSPGRSAATGAGPASGSDHIAPHDLTLFDEDGVGQDIGR